jgi:hypothetical protein
MERDGKTLRYHLLLCDKVKSASPEDGAVEFNQAKVCKSSSDIPAVYLPEITTCVIFERFSTCAYFLNWDLCYCPCEKTGGVKIS